MHDKELWNELERAAREKFGLGDDWHLAAANVEDPEVALVRMRRKGPRGGWLRGRENAVKGVIAWGDIRKSGDKNLWD